MSEPGNGFEYRFRKIEDALSTLTKRVDNIDEHGTRQVDVVKTELAHLRQDLADLAAEIRELRVDMRDTRHRLTNAEASIANLTKAVADGVGEVTGLRRSLIVSALGVSTAVIVSSATMWLAFGGPP